MKTLYTNADILTRKDGKIDFLRDAFLAVDGAVISYVGTEKPSGSFDSVKNLSGRLIIPGLVNAHTHSPMTLLRGVGSNLKLQDWLYNAIFPIEDNMDDTDCIRGMRFAIMEMLAGGTTCMEDMYWNYNILAPAAIESGIKVNAGCVIQCPDDSVEFLRQFAQRRLENSYEFYKNYHNAADGRIKFDIQLHSEYLSNDYFAESAAKLADECKLRTHVHISETASEHEESIKRHGMTPVQYLIDKGIFKYGGVAAHCVHVSDEDLELMAANDISLAHNPTSNLKLGSGIAPVVKALAKGVNVCLGTDGTASNNNLNMFEEMHIASILHKGFNMDAALITSYQAFDMATVNGYKAMGRPDCGELTPGKRADFAVIDMDKPHLTPNFDTLALLVYSAQASDVCMTVVDGRILYENGQYFTIDAEKCKAEFGLSVKKLLG